MSSSTSNLHPTEDHIFILYVNYMPMKLLPNCLPLSLLSAILRVYIPSTIPIVAQNLPLEQHNHSYSRILPVLLHLLLHNLLWNSSFQHGKVLGIDRVLPKWNRGVLHISVTKKRIPQSRRWCYDPCQELSHPCWPFSCCIRLPREEHVCQVTQSTAHSRDVGRVVPCA